ncbi:uncharacterized protein BDV14DRAFT_176725 [Aspergillus stella-maris]|uniref:uncharacterized protein n=1 Tax=Aspergillus stella-maris TaxID=1810926 RepID=UPI003CCCACB3
MYVGRCRPLCHYPLMLRSTGLWSGLVLLYLVCFEDVNPRRSLISFRSSARVVRGVLCQPALRLLQWVI